MDNKLLGSKRFDKEANIIYKLPISELPKRIMFVEGAETITEEIDFEHEDVLKCITDFIDHHRTKQLPRLKALNRYYLADGDIKYRTNKPNGRADNRISSDFAKFIVSFKQGVLLGNPIKYSGAKEISKKVNDFAIQSNEDYHNQLMARDTFTYGRGYELISRDEFGKESVAKLDVNETFVIYDNTSYQNSICGVHYYTVEYLDESWIIVEIYANDGFTYHYKAEKDDLNSLTLQEKEQNYFDSVQINEWINNEERIGDFESVLDGIDAYDLSQSEMANFQQDLSEAFLVIKGNPDTATDEEGENSSLDVFNAMLDARMLVLGDKKELDNGQTGAEPDAYYLKKEYDTQGVEAHNDRLVADILRFTSLIDFTDENMGSNQSGIGFRFKGWGSDNDRKNKERMIKKAIMRRLRLLTHSWSIKNDLESNDNQEDLYNKVNTIEVKFEPNVPQSDEEIMKVIAGLYGIVSDETICEMATKLTGVASKEEVARLLKQNNEEIENNSRRPQEQNDEEVVEDEE